MDDRPTAEPVLRYFDHVLPVRPGTAGLPLPDLLEAQHYRLAYWRDAATELNWRRFFDITSLIAIRVEDPGVFARDPRGCSLRLMAEGLIDGLRVDHPDGLADPRGYLDRLAAATGGAWVVTEKILSRRREAAADWACAGTTGYDALGVAGGLFLDPAGAAPLDRGVRSALTGGRRGLRRCGRGRQARRWHGGSLAAEVSRLARLLAHAPRSRARTACPADDLSRGAHRTARRVRRCTARTCVPGEPAAGRGRRGRDAAPPRRASSRLCAAPARTGSPAVCALVLGRRRRGRQRAAWQRELIVRFQQTCGPVMAKGVEDTAFYRWPGWSR